MAFQQYFTQEWKSITGSASGSETSNGCFDCNICLDFAQEPVVTLCGHLYCWPCIYRWLHVRSGSLASDEHPQCPVCKADISHTEMVPLYGRGQTPSKPKLQGKGSFHGMVIPPRPRAYGSQAFISPTSSTGQQLLHRNPYQNQHYDPHSLGDFQEGATTAGFQHPLAGMFGEMVYARLFGSSESLYTYPSSYQLLGTSSSPRLRRQELQADKSLNRISIFLFCCFLLCLIVF